MSGESLDGFWSCSPGSHILHFFLQGDERCLCGSHALKDADPLRREVRPPNRHDCLKCVDIRKDLFANPLPSLAAAEAWTVKTDHEDGKVHRLFYQGKEQGLARGPVGLKTLQETAALANRNGTVPTSASKAKCAADAKDPAKFLEGKAGQSPPLPLEIPNEPTTPNEPMNKTATATPPAMTGKEEALSAVLPAVRLIPASQIERYPFNRKVGAEAVKEMTASVKEIGVLQPGTARPLPPGPNGEERFQLVIGETRWLGCKAIHPDFPVPLFVRDLTDKEAARIHTVENFRREDLDEIEEAEAIKHMRETGWTLDEIKETIGREKAYVYARLSLLELDEDAHKEIRAGNLTVGTARKIGTLPQERQAEALKAVVSPKYASQALPEREALQLLEREFVVPIKAAAEWEKKRKLAEKENPGAIWLEHEAARAAGNYNSGYTIATQRPANWKLSDAAKNEELKVPTWGELAKKHGAKVFIGTNYNEEIVLYVEEEPLIAAELAAFDEKPAECIFPHEKAKAAERKAAEKRKIAEEAQREAIAAEKKRFIALILDPAGMNKTVTKKLVEGVGFDLFDIYCDLGDLIDLLEVPCEAGEEADDKAVAAAYQKYLRNKAFVSPLEAVARLQLAIYFEHGTRWETLHMFDSGLCKPADFPASHKAYQKDVKEKAAHEAALAKAAEKAAAAEEAAKAAEAEKAAKAAKKKAKTANPEGAAV